MSERHVVWFSCGAASAVLAKIIADTKPESLVVVYCDLGRDEHPDNVRFRADVERWIGVPVTVISSKRYSGVEDVFDARRYMSGIAGAPCAVEMKKVPRFAFQKPDDVHHFGLTFDESKRIERFSSNNHDLNLNWILREAEITKAACFGILNAAGIRLPEMYRLGYRNNNCIGCVKATSAAYWLKVRSDFPDVFARRAEQSRRLGARLARWRGKRVFLDELPKDAPSLPLTESISCGPECGEGRVHP